MGQNCFVAKVRLILVGLALSLVAPLPVGFTGAASAQTAATTAQAQTRDNLIAAQEALLNVYRCKFDIDTEVVPGGCQDGSPMRPAPEPTPFTGTPTAHDIAVRDRLVASQEALLNTYRCRFDIDTEVVPGGCVGGTPARVQVRIAVAQTPPSGRCAHTISSGSYNWERCAWAEHWEDREFNHSLSDAEGRTLIAKIWTEVDTEGKPKDPPSSELVPAGSTCATAVAEGVIIACYQPGNHHIRRLDSFLQTLLHETAHALVALHPSIQACQRYSDPHDYNTCAHNDIFRCVADHLYVQYAGIPSAGVCGKAEQLPTGPDDADRWNSFSFDGGGRAAGVPVYVHTRGFPYEDSDGWLFVRCDQGRTDVFISVEEGHLAGQIFHNNRIPVGYAFLPADYFSWDETRQSDVIAANRKTGLWGESNDNRAAFLPPDQQVDFINTAVADDNSWLMISIENWDGSDFGIFVFSLVDAYDHIRPVTEQCGWTWN